MDVKWLGTRLKPNADLTLMQEVDSKSAIPAKWMLFFTPLIIFELVDNLSKCVFAKRNGTEMI